MHNQWRYWSLKNISIMDAKIFLKIFRGSFQIKKEWTFLKHNDEKFSDLYQSEDEDIRILCELFNILEKKIFDTMPY